MSESVVVSVRPTPAQHAELKAQAATAGVSVAAHALACLLDGMRRARPGVSVRRLDSGGELTIWPTNDPLLERDR